MSDYTRFGDLDGHNLEEPQLLAYCPRGVACYGCAMCVVDSPYSYGNGMMMAMPGSPVEMPGSPSSDCSASTASLDGYLSPPASPFHSEDSCSSFSSTSTSSTWTRHARPAKSSLRRVSSSRQQRRVTWDPETVFETRPLVRKRRRTLMEAADQEQEDSEISAPAPTKRSKMAESLESQASATFRPHIAHTSTKYASSMQTLCPELARSVVPCFDFSSCLAITMTKQTTPSTANIETSRPSTPATPSFVSFSIAKPKAPVVSSLLSKI